jgi:LacI family transcriptional regulator, galactose operon repressor
MSYTDMMAVGAMDAASSHGVKIPEEMRFVGCGDDALLCGMRVPLSSIALGEREVGQRAGRLALRAIGGANAGGMNRVLVKPKLLKRRSSERLR